MIIIIAGIPTTHSTLTMRVCSQRALSSVADAGACRGDGHDFHQIFPPGWTDSGQGNLGVRNDIGLSVTIDVGMKVRNGPQLRVLGLLGPAAEPPGRADSMEYFCK